MAYNKNSIDREAEQEAKALQRQGYNASALQGRNHKHTINRTRQRGNYNTVIFDKLFRDKWE